LRFGAKKLSSPAAAPILNFPRANGNSGLILNGGLLYLADSSTTFTISRVQVVSQSYLSGAGGF
jgi:hypothetical protein